MATDGFIQERFRSETLVHDSIHGYISIASPPREPIDGETAYERDLVDSPWVQRLRQIHQLQTAWYVYPTAEHSRFQHVLGTMQLASRVWNAWNESFYAVFENNPHLVEQGASEEARRPLPSRNCLEALLRVAGLLHDVGHGPFGHFFDENFLKKYTTPSGERLTHETLGAEIVRTRLADTIKGIRRSPRGVFEPGESLSPEDVAYLIIRPKSEEDDAKRPAWLQMLRILFSGLYTIDNMDFVLRDAYASGVSLSPYDLERLIHYTFFTEKGLTLHRKGVGALLSFLEARSGLFRSVYYHRTVRAIDVELADLFRKGADLLYPYGNPLDSLDEYLRFTDWSLLSDVGNWDRSDIPRKQELAGPWRAILERRIPWRLLAEKTFVVKEGEPEQASLFSEPSLFEAAIRNRLPSSLQDLPLRFDVARASYRPESIAAKNYLYQPETGDVASILKDPILRETPKSMRVCRVYGRNTTGREEIVAAINELAAGGVDELTNV
ncbi:MAG: HD domain-containing protein [Thermoguttaceae bacterium]|jgi:HD superfamily phosphohydrolase